MSLKTPSVHSQLLQEEDRVIAAGEGAALEMVRPFRRVQVICLAPRKVGAEFEVSDIHNVYEGNRCVDSYKYGRTHFKTLAEAHAYISANGGRMLA